jgi:hypothetical protein
MNEFDSLDKKWIVMCVFHLLSMKGERSCMNFIHEPMVKSYYWWCFLNLISIEIFFAWFTKIGLKYCQFKGQLDEVGIILSIRIFFVVCTVFGSKLKLAFAWNCKRSYLVFLFKKGNVFDIENHVFN